MDDSNNCVANCASRRVKPTVEEKRSTHISPTKNDNMDAGTDALHEHESDESLSDESDDDELPITDIDASVYSQVLSAQKLPMVESSTQMIRKKKKKRGKKSKSKKKALTPAQRRAKGVKSKKSNLALLSSRSQAKIGASPSRSKKNLSKSKSAVPAWSQSNIRAPSPLTQATQLSQGFIDDKLVESAISVPHTEVEFVHSKPVSVSSSKKLHHKTKFVPSEEVSNTVMLMDQSTASLINEDIGPSKNAFPFSSDEERNGSEPGEVVYDDMAAQPRNDLQQFGAQVEYPKSNTQMEFLERPSYQAPKRTSVKQSRASSQKPQTQSRTRRSTSKQPQEQPSVTRQRTSVNPVTQSRTRRSTSKQPPEQPSVTRQRTSVNRDTVSNQGLESYRAQSKERKPTKTSKTLADFRALKSDSNIIANIGPSSLDIYDADFDDDDGDYSEEEETAGDKVVKYSKKVGEKVYKGVGAFANWAGNAYSSYMQPTETPELRRTSSSKQYSTSEVYPDQANNEEILTVQQMLVQPSRDELGIMSGLPSRNVFPSVQITPTETSLESEPSLALFSTPLRGYKDPDTIRDKIMLMKDAFATPLSNLLASNLLREAENNHIIASHLFPPPKSTPEYDALAPEVLQLVNPQSDGQVFVVGVKRYSDVTAVIVEETIRILEPDIVFVQMNEHRAQSLGDMKSWTRLYEEELGGTVYSKQKWGDSFQQYGYLGGTLKVLMDSLQSIHSKHHARFREYSFAKAVDAARKLPFCDIVYGDRPHHISLQRLFRTLSLQEKRALAWRLIKGHMQPESFRTITNFPSARKVLIDEVDKYIVSTLQFYSQATIQTTEGLRPMLAVAVVWEEHLPGIERYFGKRINVHPLLEIPYMTSDELILEKLVGVTPKLLLGTIAFYTAYKLYKGSQHFKRNYWDGSSAQSLSSNTWTRITHSFS